MKKVNIHPSAELAWGIANREACLSGSSRIEPAHFLLAALQIIDGMFEEEASAMELSPDQINEVFKETSRCRQYLEITDDELTSARRSLRQVLRKDVESHETVMLHRSGKSRFIFQRAARAAFGRGQEGLALFDLFEQIITYMPTEGEPLLKKRKSESGGKKDSEWPDYIAG